MGVLILKLVNSALIHTLVVFCISQIVSSQTQGWDCFKCSSTMDDLCLTNPGAITDVIVGNCTGYCTIVRTEFTDVPGKVISLVRDCEKEPLVKNEIRTDAHYTKYFRSCTTNRCNNGNGIIGSGGNGNLPSDVIRVAEKSAGNRISTSIQYCILTFLLSKFVKLSFY